MNEPTRQNTIEDRRDPRVDLSQQVTIRFEAGSILGSGQNVSAQGVFFLAPASIPVTVHIDGKEEVVQGELVRVETMGDGRVGIAVRFREANPSLMGE